LKTAATITDALEFKVRERFAAVKVFEKFPLPDTLRRI